MRSWKSIKKYCDTMHSPVSGAESFVRRPARKLIQSGIAFLLTSFCLATAHAQIAINANWKQTGTLKTRNAKKITASTWSIGGETLDRDYTDYQSYKSYLGPLGATR